jgi:hypothetical protein
LKCCAKKIKPNEWNRLVSEWRTRVRLAHSRDDVLVLFRTVVYDIVKERCDRQNTLQQINEHDNEFSNRSRRAQSALEQRSTSLAELSVRGLHCQEKYTEMHEIV